MVEIGWAGLVLAVPAVRVIGLHGICTELTECCWRGSELGWLELAGRSSSPAIEQVDGKLAYVIPKSSING